MKKPVFASLFLVLIGWLGVIVSTVLNFAGIFNDGTGFLLIVIMLVAGLGYLLIQIDGYETLRALFLSTVFQLLLQVILFFATERWDCKGGDVTLSCPQEWQEMFIAYFQFGGGYGTALVMLVLIALAIITGLLLLGSAVLHYWNTPKEERSISGLLEERWELSVAVAFGFITAALMAL